MEQFTVVIYPKGAAREIVDVRAESELQAVIKALNIFLGDDVYDEEDIKFNSVDEVREDVKPLGIYKIDDVLYRN